MKATKVLRLDELHGLCHECHSPIAFRSTVIGQCPHCGCTLLSLVASKVLAKYSPAQLKQMQTLVVRDGNLIGGE